MGKEYDDLHGRALICGLIRPDPDALKERSVAFQQRCGKLVVAASA
jgi:hypothetical protein